MFTLISIKCAKIRKRSIKEGCAYSFRYAKWTSERHDTLQRAFLAWKRLTLGKSAHCASHDYTDAACRYSPPSALSAWLPRPLVCYDRAACCASKQRQNERQRKPETGGCSVRVLEYHARQCGLQMVDEIMKERETTNFASSSSIIIFYHTLSCSSTRGTNGKARRYTRSCQLRWRARSLVPGN